MESSGSTTPRSTRVERYDTIVIGAGQAGLAVGYHLAARDVDFVILDSASRVGDSWRKRWDSLRLFTTAAHCALPGMPFPAPPAHLPDRDEVADYLERYAERMDLPIRLDTRVDSLARVGDRYVIRSGESRLEAENVVVATGPFQRPRIPAVAPRLAPEIRQLHSSEYRNPFDLPDGSVLVVGAGNSGAQIALELARFRKVWLAGRESGHLPRRVLGRDIFDWLWPVIRRITASSALGRRLRRHSGRADPLVGMSARMLARAGMQRVERVTGERGGLPVCGTEVIEPSVVIWCTGYEPDYRWMELPVLGESGWPRQSAGVAPDSPGLYFVGLRFQRALTSALLGGVGEDAAFIADQVAAGAGSGLES
ncbi:MAG TPA: NAD(P)-binding domain-containing protein [Gemmatimonadaceae bacterium]|jgi:putative flavoprotein involved in K+ transport|nr:NAD(P)-binding domain-containing protein [Gemmatimonadaceae bacterium]